jgi:hypothetical protein
MVPYLAHSLPLKMKAILTSEMSVAFHWTTRCYIPEDRIAYNEGFDNLKSAVKVFYSFFLYVLCSNERCASRRSYKIPSQVSCTENLALAGAMLNEVGKNKIRGRLREICKQ